MEVETDSYLLAFDPRWAWKACGTRITLYNKNTQITVSLERDTGLETRRKNFASAPHPWTFGMKKSLVLYQA